MEWFRAASEFRSLFAGVLCAEYKNCVCECDCASNITNSQFFGSVFASNIKNAQVFGSVCA
jgi:hypothetical protein